MNAIWILPLVGAVLGWGTNALAVRMIFRPRRRILGIQGLVPRRRRELAQSIGSTVAGHLVRREDVLQAVPLDKMRVGFEELVGERVDAFIEKRLLTLNPMLGAFISDEMRAKIRNGVVAEMTELLPILEERLATGLEEGLDVQKVVTEKIESFEIERLERLILEVASRELKAIELIGAVIGAVVGLAQWALIHHGVISL